MQSNVSLHQRQMISEEPKLRVGIIDGRRHIGGEFNGRFAISERPLEGTFTASVDSESMVITGHDGNVVARGNTIICEHQGDSTFTLCDVTIGAGFHWERKERQQFRGDLMFLLRGDGRIVAINTVPLEQYLASVISSEMNPEAPLEFLKAHALTSRSWLIAMLEKKAEHRGAAIRKIIENENELIRWYDREDHDLFDVCADDHCQRYQGITRIVSGSVATAIEETRGVCLVYENRICDARFSKACGGITEQFESCWDDTPVPYLQSVADSVLLYKPIMSEPQAEAWIRSSPEAYCNTADGNVLRQVLPSFDRETSGFFRWKVEYQREELEELLRTKSGFDLGTLNGLVPVERGPSGRIVKLRIEGSRKTLTVGKELEIRRWLSATHLYSSAFVVETERDPSGIPKRFVLRGAGWGHGVGLCQIGAAVMAMKGLNAQQIVKHYFYGAELKKLYT